MPPIPAIAASLIISATLWGVSITDACTEMMPLSALAVTTAGAVMWGIIGSLLWVARAMRSHAGSLGLLVRTVENVTRPAETHSRLRQVR